jgi:uncharacterized protein
VPLLLRNVALDFTIDEADLLEHILRRLTLAPGDIAGWRVVRRGLDARKKSALRFVYTFELTVVDEARCLERFRHDPDVVHVLDDPVCSLPQLVSDRSVVITGMGPAGLFAALRLADYGLRATVVERGRPVEERIPAVHSFWERGELDPESNVQFGEGGAGTFSDGKLTTRIRDENLRYILAKLVQFGAPREILWQAKPHVGTDRLRDVVSAIRHELISHGFIIKFSSKVTDIVPRDGRVGAVVLNEADELPCEFLVLATGHSARDTYELLERRGVHLNAKPFAIGVRVEHPQELINHIQYGIASHPCLPPAEYALTHRDVDTERAVYSFCMCPGGVIMAAASGAGEVVTNGMSFYRRNSTYANSALIVSVDERDFSGPHALAGIDFQRVWEHKAFKAGKNTYGAPAQNLMDFVNGNGARGVRSSYRPGVVETPLRDVLPAAVVTALRGGIKAFDRKMRGFYTAEASVTGVETRTSAPVRIVRGADFQSVSLPGLFPTGEGAGYAGGIMSAALDGIRVADQIARELQRETRSVV